MGIAAIIWTLGESIWFLPFPFLYCKGLLSLELLLKYSSLKIPRGGTWQFHKIMSTLSEPWISLSQETDNFRAHLWGPHGDVLYNTSWREGSRKEVRGSKYLPSTFTTYQFYTRTRCISEWPDAVGFESQLEYRQASPCFHQLFQLSSHWTLLVFGLENTLPEKKNKNKCIVW